MKYEFLDHTADVCIRVYGNSFAEVLKHSALAMMDLITDRENVEVREEVEIVVEGESEEQLIVRWLQEILYELEVKRIFFSEFVVELVDGNHIKGKALGEEIDTEKHEFGTDVKAVSYHGLKLKKVNDRLQVDIIFDI